MNTGVSVRQRRPEAWALSDIIPKGKTRYEFDYRLEDTHLAGEAQTVCQALFARPRQLLGLRR